MFIDLFLDLGDQGDGEAHPVCPAHTPDTMDIVLLLIREGDVDYEGDTSDVDSPCCYVCADEEPHLPLL